MSLPIRAGQAPQAPLVQLMLETPDGSRWPVTLSEGMERFIGHYRRVPGLGSGGPLLRFEPVARARA